MIPVSRSGDVKPKVIIAISSHNYAQYISQAIDSVLSQKTDFPFEIHISDDASTDDTPRILRAYKKRFPDKIHILLAKNNGGHGVNWFRLLNRIDSEYFSILDSDDFWVGDTRLQRQVDFLDSHPEYMLCSGFTQLLVNGKPGAVFPPKEYAEGTYTFEDYFRRPVLFHLSGLLLRNKIYCKWFPHLNHNGLKEEDLFAGDNPTRMMHLERGPLYVLPDFVSCYRIHTDSRYQARIAASPVAPELDGVISTLEDVLYYYGRYPDMRDAFLGYVRPYWQRLWQKLINEGYIYPTYRLTGKETATLVRILSILGDMNDADHWLDERENV